MHECVFGVLALESEPVDRPPLTRFPVSNPCQTRVVDGRTGLVAYAAGPDGTCTRRRRSCAARRAPPAHPGRGRRGGRGSPSTTSPTSSPSPTGCGSPYCGPEVELESLINAKSGACPEDCAFCSQSARYSTDVDVYPFLDLDEVLDAARATKAAGATQFCIVVAVRGPEERLLTKVIDAVDAVHTETGLEVACSLGLLTQEQAERLAAAGVKRYNHNLEAPREVFPSICTTHTYDDRVATANLAIDAGHGAVLRRHPRHGRDARAAHRLRVRARRARPHARCRSTSSMPSGTPLGEERRITPREALQAIALFRLVLPAAWLRLAGGRELVLGELQAMGLLAGANALIVGNYLTTSGRPAEEDHALLDALGMPVADGPGEGRFIVDGDGAHAPARPKLRQATWPRRARRSRVNVR